MNTKQLSLIVGSALMLTIFVACSDELVVNKAEEASLTSSSSSEISGTEEIEDTEKHEDSNDYLWDSSEVMSVELNGSSVKTNNGEVTAVGSTVTIGYAGTYSFSGTLDDGQIIVDTEDEGIVRLILNGVDISCSDSSPIVVENADKVVIVLASGSKNTISDGTEYSFDTGDEDEPNAAIFSHSNLTIYGQDDSSLTVEANYKDGISSKDGLIIRNANITVDAADDAIRGKDYLLVFDSEISVDAGDNGLKADNDNEDKLADIELEGSSLDIVSGGDAVSATNNIKIKKTDLEITSNGSDSSKGLKAKGNITVNGGNINIDTADDGIHAKDTVIINDGAIEIASDDDGIHADAQIEINDGNITISKSYEGIESGIIIINGGDIDITSSDDGTNVAGGNDGSEMGGRPGQGGFESVSGEYYTMITGGYLHINAGGDGLDSNGPVTMTGGTVIIDGPTNNGNGPLDYTGGFSVSGGYLLAAGSSGMAQAPSDASTQYSVLINFDSTQEAGTLVNIQNSAGESVLTFAPAKQYQSIAFSAEDLVEGETYTIYLGGSSTGEAENGLYIGGTYSDGTEYESFTVSNITTTVGTSSGMGGFGGGGMRGMRGTPPDGTMPTDMGTPPEMPEGMEIAEDMDFGMRGTPPDNMTPPDWNTAQ